MVPFLFLLYSLEYSYNSKFCDDVLNCICVFSSVKFFQSLIEKLTSPTSSEPIKKMETSDVVLVAGATGGVGRRVVNILCEKGLPVRVLVFYCPVICKMYSIDSLLHMLVKPVQLRELLCSWLIEV